MIKTLVSIEKDLTSSLAIRFACQLGAFLNMEIHPVYVKESAARESVYGAGWAGRTWEKEMVKQGKNEIADLIAAEMDFCPVLRTPRVIYGEKGPELSRITQTEDFDLYVEGIHFSWTPHDILKHLNGKLYQGLPYPLILVRALRKVNSVRLLLPDAEGARTLSQFFHKIWKNCPVPLILSCPAGDTDTSEIEPLREAVEEARSLLEKAGCTVQVQEDLPWDSGRASADVLKDDALTAIAVERPLRKESSALQWLSLVKTSSLLAFH